jgi:phage shock protein PspC (stress-responsive transcriptional regulator)
MVSRLRAFLAFLYDFVIGDDWRIAAGVVAGLALTYAVSKSSVPAWWLLPVLLVVMLPVSLWLAARRR